jgi:hypothetical protein
MRTIPLSYILTENSTNIPVKLEGGNNNAIQFTAFLTSSVGPGSFFMVTNL